jgi:hypothetical protein
MILIIVNKYTLGREINSKCEFPFNHKNFKVKACVKSSRVLKGIRE